MKLASQVTLLIWSLSHNNYFIIIKKKIGKWMFGEDKLFDERYAAKIILYA